MIRPTARVNLVALIAFLMTLNVIVAFSQVVTGTVLGRITDTSGAVVPGATVQIQNVDTGFSQAAQSDSEGRYVSRSLPLGSYAITVQQAGFRTEVRNGIVLTVAREVTLNVELAVGNVQEKVEVTAEAPLVEMTNATVSGLVSSEQMRDLPLNGRNIDSLALLSPGVLVNHAQIPNASFGVGLAISINGGRPDANLYLLDGTVVNDHTTQGFASAANATLGVEGVREYRLLTHSFSAEYGRNSGGVISAVTRSGTNEFHGSAYEFVRNNIFDARNFFNVANAPAPTPLPAFRRNQFGAAAGGRIIKDRMFFFANYEGLRQRLGNTVISTVPDLDARKGLIPATISPATGLRTCTTPGTLTAEGLCQFPVSQAAVPYVNLYPLPNGRNNGDGTAQNLSDFSSPATENYAMERMDFRLSDKDSFYWRYVYDPSYSLAPTAIPLFGNTVDSTNHFVVLSESHVFSGASLNEFRFAFNRAYRAKGSVPIVSVDPSLSFVPGQLFGTIRYSAAGQGTFQLSQLGTDQGGALTFTQNLFQESDTFSTVRGAHSLKFGVDLERIQLQNTQARSARGAYQFGGLTSLLSGTSSQFTLFVQDANSTPSRGWRRTLTGWFIQDDYRVRSNLTLNLGLRHEFFNSPSEVNGKMSALRNITDAQNTPGPPFEPSKMNFAPRVGLAWDPTGSGKTSVRLGAGIFYNQVDGRTWVLTAYTNSDFAKTFVLSSPPFPNAATSNFPKQLIEDDYIQFHLDTPTVIHYNLDVQRQLLPSLSLRIGYIGSNGYNMTRLSYDNLKVAQIQPDGSRTWLGTGPSINPNFSVIQGVRADADSNYNGLQIVLQKTLSAGLQFQGSYSHSKAHSNADEIVNGQTLSTAPTALDPYNLARDYSLSAYDQRNTFVLSGGYQMPWDKRLNGTLAKAALGGWVLRGIYTYGSGLPFDVQAGFNNSRNGDTNQPDRPNLAPGFSNNPINGVTAGCQGVQAGQKLHTPNLWFDPCAFLLPDAGTLGNLGRNTVTAPGTSNVDLTLAKNTPLTEHKMLEFRAEFFNLLNHAAFALPNTSLFNTPGRTRNGNDGQINSTAAANRQIQLGMKFIF